MHIVHKLVKYLLGSFEMSGKVYIVCPLCFLGILGVRFLNTDSHKNGSLGIQGIIPYFGALNPSFKFLSNTTEILHFRILFC